MRERILCLLLLAGAVLLATPTALWAGDKTGAVGASVFPVNPNASGTKYTGPLALFFQEIGNPFNRCDPTDPGFATCLVAFCGDPSSPGYAQCVDPTNPEPARKTTCALGEVDMTFGLRLKQGGTEQAFSGDRQSTLADKLCLDDVPLQVSIVGDFIATTVVPALGGTVGELKAVVDLAQANNFAVLDITLAVR